MAEETRRCRTCNKERPQDAFKAPETAGKEFYKLCEPCRTKFRNVSISDAQMGKAFHLLIRSRLKTHRNRELKGRKETRDELGHIISPSQHPKLTSTLATRRRELSLKAPVPCRKPPCLCNRIVYTRIPATAAGSQLHRPLSKVLRKAQQPPLSSPFQPPSFLKM